MAHRNIEREIERLGLLREAPRREATAALRKALTDRVNLMVAKAAKIAAELEIRELIPELLRTFDRLFEEPVERDPQCWGKNAIANALRDLGHHEAAPFLRGIRHVQMESGWGKAVDTAPELRGICLLALLPCVELRREEVMRHLVDAMTDEAHTVRVEAARGLEQMEGEESALLLRLKAHLGDDDAAVVGQVFDSLLKLEQDRGIGFVAGFLKSRQEVREEAALSLGTSRLPGAVDILQEAWDSAHDPEFRQVILRAMSVSRQERALEFLLRLVREGRAQDAKAALEALSLHRDTPEIRRLAEAAASQGGAAAKGLFAQLFA
ncbi:MAG: HEAT repeat domain-containing protein [Acidobacteriia bacterium]|nr:HEAT repeat domain-containing protein [Terriglobia bacterium]